MPRGDDQGATSLTQARCWPRTRRQPGGTLLPGRSSTSRRTIIDRRQGRVGAAAAIDPKSTHRPAGAELRRPDRGHAAGAPARADSDAVDGWPRARGPAAVSLHELETLVGSVAPTLLGTRPAVERTTSAVKSVLPRKQAAAYAVGVGRHAGRSNARMRSALKPPLTTILTCVNPSPSRARRTRATSSRHHAGRAELRPSSATANGRPSSPTCRGARPTAARPSARAHARRWPRSRCRSRPGRRR